MPSNSTSTINPPEQTPIDTPKISSVAENEMISLPKNSFLKKHNSNLEMESNT